jgi:glutathione S-transferase
VALSWAQLIRAGSGTRVARRLGPRPRARLELYEFETCPFCRKVREAIQVLDLEVLVWPCPKGGERHRPRARALGGRAQFPLLVDPNAEVVLYESDAIVRHLFERYGRTRPPWPLGAGALDTTLSMLAGLAHPADGTFAVASVPPQAPLDLYADEGSTGARRVRARLCELEVPYVSHSMALGSSGRAELAQRGLDVPALIDAELGVEVAGAEAALAHLERYRAG